MAKEEKHHKPVEKQTDKPAQTDEPPAEMPKDDPKDTPQPLAEVVPPTTETMPAQTQSIKKRFSFGNFIHSTKGKVTMVVVALLVIVGIVFAVPATRYALLAPVVKKDVSFSLIDSATKKPVTEATVKLDNQQAISDNEGKVSFKSVSVGPHNVVVQKKYYKDQSTTVNIWVFSAPSVSQMTLQATGRQVPVKVINQLTKKPVENATITAAETTASTDASGQTNIVLPADQTEVSATITADNYNSATDKIKVTDQVVDDNTFTITPAGKVYFLSKRSGVINVMKSNLDGTQQAVVVEGTGNEDEGDTQLIATRDWHYIVLKARRDSKQAKLYLINSSNDNMSVIDTGDDTTDFQPVGWHNEYLVYTVNKSKLKSFNASNGALATLDQTQSLGNSQTNDYASESFATIQIVKDKVVYLKVWYFGCAVWSYNTCTQYSHFVFGQNDTVNVVSPNGNNKQTMYSYLALQGNTPGYIYGKPEKTDQVIIQLTRYGSNNSYKRYINGNLSDAGDMTDALYDVPATTRFVSPSGQYSFWYEARDGKNTLLVGNGSGDNGTVVASGTDYTPLGWYSDDYMLASKNGSELYIMPRQDTANHVSKITDFHRPAYSWPGQGYSYGWMY